MIFVLLPLGVLALVVLTVVIVSVRRFGSISAAFRKDLKADRKRLVEQRAAVRSLTRERDRAVRDAQSVVDKASKAYDDRVGQRKRRLAELEEPGKGSKVLSLKDVVLFTHVVQVAGRTVPLAGAKAHVVTTASSANLYVTDASGRSHMRTFDTRLKDVGGPQVHEGVSVTTVTQKQKQDFSDEQILTLANAINNAVITEEAFLEQLPVALAGAAADLEASIADTAEVETAAAELDRVRNDADLLERLRAAEADLSAAEQEWATALGQPAPDGQPAEVDSGVARS